MHSELPFLTPQMLPYSVSFLVFMIFASLELLSFLLGWGIFDFLDDFFDAGHADMESDATTTLGGFFSYLNPHKVPLSMVILSFFFLFGLTGNLLQTLIGVYPLSVTIPVVLPITLVALRHTTSQIGKVIPRETTEVVSSDSFIGKEAVILDPVATRGNPARAKLRDVYGSMHYIRVEPHSEEDTFKEGDKVIVLEKDKSIFRVEKSMMQ